MRIMLSIAILLVSMHVAAQTTTTPQDTKSTETVAPAETKPAKKAPESAYDGPRQPSSTIDWSDSHIPKKILRKHRTGIALTVIGGSFIVGGIGMIAGGAAQYGQVSTVSNGYQTQTNVNVGPIGGVGIVAMIAGIPMLIVGAVKLAKAKKLARPYSR